MKVSTFKFWFLAVGPGATILGKESCLETVGVQRAQNFVLPRHTNTTTHQLSLSDSICRFPASSRRLLLPSPPPLSPAAADGVFFMTHVSHLGQREREEEGNSPQNSNGFEKKDHNKNIE